MPDHDAIQREFERAAEGFAERSAGRFDDLGVLEFSRVQPGALVVEVGAGTGNFLSLFAEITRRLIAVDLTHGMLRAARERFPYMTLVAADGARLPLRSRSVALVASAQALHHVRRPVDVLKEMRRVCAPDGSVLVVDQAAPERYEEAIAMTELERLRDPTHAASRPPSAFRTIVRAAGLEIVDERVHFGEQRLSGWMWPGEFPPQRIDAVRAFIERRGSETGMRFRRDGDDWIFERRRIMLLARRI